MKSNSQYTSAVSDVWTKRRTAETCKFIYLFFCLNDQWLTCIMLWRGAVETKRNIQKCICFFIYLNWIYKNDWKYLNFPLRLYFFNNLLTCTKWLRIFEIWNEIVCLLGFDTVFILEFHSRDQLSYLRCYSMKMLSLSILTSLLMIDPLRFDPFLLGRRMEHSNHSLIIFKIFLRIPVDPAFSTKL